MAGKGKRATPIAFQLKFETACSLQAILTQQSFHIEDTNNEILKEEFDEIMSFYKALTGYVENNA